MNELLDYKVTFQVTCFLFSLLVNTLLIHLIITKSTKKMGNYRHLMVYFCCCSIFFSIMDVVVRPIIHTHKSAFFMMMDLRDRSISVHAANVMVCVMAGCFAVIIYGIAIHFVFRYFALERNGRTRYFANKWLPFWFTIPILGGASWTLVSLYCFPMTPTSSSYIKETIKASYDMNIEQTAFAAAIFYPTDKNGHRFFNRDCFLGLICYLLIMIIPFTIIITVFLKSVKKIKSFPTTKFARSLQMQLYKALVAQTLIPVLFLFIPFAIIFICPLFELDCQVLSGVLTFVYALYPVVDPLPIIFFIQCYRDAVRRMFTRRLRPANKISTVSEDIESREMSYI